MDPTQLPRKRAAQYWYSDGINEIAFGILLLLLGGYFYLDGSLPEGHVLHSVLGIGLVFLLVGGGMLLSRLVTFAKGRLTYPRTGFVGYPRHKAPVWARVLLATMIGGMMAFIIIRIVLSHMDIERWMPGLAGLLFGGVLFYIGVRVATLRYFLLSLIALSLGSALALGDRTGSLDNSIFFALLGLAVILSGGCSLFLYLRTNPAPAEVSDES